MMTLDWWTLALQAVNFVVLVWLLWRFLFRPVRAVIEKRKALAEQAFAEADKARQEAEEARARHEAAQAALVGERAELRRAMHQELEAQRTKTAEAAERAEAETVAAARAEIDREREAALEALRRDAAALAVDLASALLKSSGSTALDNGCLGRIENELKDLPAEERTRLAADLDTDDATLSVITAAPLAPEDRDRWRMRIGAALGAEGRIEFDDDASLIGGARLRFPHAVLDFSWAAQLGRAQEALSRDDAAS